MKNSSDIIGNRTRDLSSCSALRQIEMYRSYKKIDCRIAVLRSIPKEAFADSFQKLYERCQQRVVRDGDYFESQ
jgi:hypothetical protein